MPAQGAIGLDIGADTIIALELTPHGDRPCLRQFAAAHTPEKKEELSEAIRNIFESQNFSSRKVRLSVGGPSVIVRYISLPHMTQKELGTSIVYEAEKYIPFKTDDVYLDYCVLGETPVTGGKKRVNVILAAAKKEKVKELVELVQAANVQAEIVDVCAVAILNAFQYSQPDARTERVCQVDFGARCTTANIIDEGIPVFTRDVSFGGEDIMNALVKGLNVSVDEANRIVREVGWSSAQWKEAVAKPFDHITSEVRLSVDYFERQLNEEKKIQKVYIHGGVSKIPGFQQALEKELGYPVQHVDPLLRLEVAENVDKALLSSYSGQYMNALGLALHGSAYSVR